MQAVHGLGGIGKTQLALEFAYAHAADYDVVWWIRADEPATLAADVAELARALQGAGLIEGDQRFAIEAVKRWLAKSERWLLIFDSAREPRDVAPYLTASGSGHVIITSRHASWRGVAAALALGELYREDSVAFLMKRTGQDDADGAEELAEALGDLPLALAQAGAYIEESSATFASYLALFRRRQRELLGRGAATDAAPTVATTWDLAFQEVRGGSAAAGELLDLCAFLAPDDVPRDGLVTGADYLPRALGAAARDGVALDDAIAALRRYSLIEAQDASLSTHRLVQAVVRERLAPDEQRAWAERATWLVLASFPEDVESPDAREICARWLPHARAATTHAEALGVAPDATWLLLARAAKSLRVHGSLGGAEGPYDAHDDARGLYERALGIAEVLHGPSHPNVARMLRGLGLTLQQLDDLKGAKALVERALAIDEATFDPNHPTIARDHSALGTVLLRMGDLEGACRHKQRALAIDEATLGRTRPDELARRLNDLGVLLREMGQLEDARVHLERALAIGEAVHGPSDTNVATYLSNLAGALQEIAERARRAGDRERAQACFEAARDYLERALIIGEEAYGERHYAVAIRRNNLGLLLMAVGDLEGARDQIGRALEIMREALGPDHRRVAKLENNLRVVLSRMQLRDPSFRG